MQAKKGKVALYAGTFDPPSIAHLDVVKRALSICDKLVVGIAINYDKVPVFTFEERKSLFHKVTREYEDKIEVEKISGLLADYV